MANRFSAIKRIRQTRRRTAVNRRNRGLLRAALRTVRQALASEDPQAARQHLPQALSRIDKSVQKGVLHKNAAGRLKSRLMTRWNALSRSREQSAATQ